MVRTLAVLRRLRTIELKSMRAVSEFALTAVRADQAGRDPIDLQSNLILAETHLQKISEFDLEILEHPELSEEDAEMEGQNYENNRNLGLRSIANLKACLQAVQSTSSTGGEHMSNSRANVLLVPNAEGRRSESSPGFASGDSVSADVMPEPFDGDRLHYRSFIAQFNNWVSRRRTFSDLDKLIVLRKLLRGEARNLIEGLEIIDANFDVAIGLLQQAFGQVNIERQQIMSSLFNLPRVGKSSDLAGLRSLLNTVQSCIQRMRTLGAPLSEFALALEPVLHSAIPSHLVFDYAESSSRTTLASNCASQSPSESSGSSTLAVLAAENITGLIDYLRRFTSHREQTELTRQPYRKTDDNDYRKPASSNNNQKRRVPAPHFQDATVAPVTEARRDNRSCFFCKEQNHLPSQCPAKIDLKQRREIIEKNKRCPSCFRFRHGEGSKCQGPREKCGKCNSQEHYTIMHPDNPRSTVTNAAAIASVDAEQGDPIVLLHTASAYAVSGNRRIPIRLFLDSGSSATFVRPDLLKRLSLCDPISTARMGFATFTDEKTLLLRRFQLTIQSVNDSARVDVRAYEYEFMANPAPHCSDRDRKIIDDFGSDHVLADTALAQCTVGHPISLLVGRDQFFKIAHVGQEKTLEGELVARNSILGWIIGGATGTTDEPRPELIRANVHCCVASVSRSARELEKLWQLEAIGIEKEETSPLSADEQSAVRQFNETLSYDGSSYTIAVPKTPGIEDLSCNFRGALDRLRNKILSLRKNPSTYARYHQEVMSFVEQGHAEIVEEFPTEIDASELRGMRHRYFMPHHNVVTKLDEGEKWRIVFDCSSAARGSRSLNSYLLTGPNLNPEIIKVLLNFRLHAIAVSADISRAYLCINLVQQDRPYFQFLWRGPDDRNIRCFQMKKVTWGATPSGYLLAAVLRHHFTTIDPESSLNLGESFYHDDMLRSFPTVESASEFTDFVQDGLRLAGMQLAKWKTNSGALAEHLTGRGVPEAALNLATGKLLKVLGISWLPTEDTFQFDLQHVTDQVRAGRITTKRLVLKLVASLYDPLGWVAPFLIRGKLLLRNLWQKDLHWDDPLGSELLSEAKRWGAEVASLSSIRIPRCVGAREIPCVERHLHVFGDASPLAFAAVAYLQTYFADGSSRTSIVMSKTRVAPRQTLSLPRLELMAALLAARLRDYIIRQLAIPVSRTMFYTDSMVAYHWCTSPSAGQWKVFVANRLAEIQSLSTASEWYHLPGVHNVADLATRGISAEDLSKSASWWRGPDWLGLPKGDRPISQPGQNIRPPLGPAEVELRGVTLSALIVQTESCPLIDVKRFSTLGRVLQTIVCVRDAISRMRRRALSNPVVSRREALTYLIKATQKEFFPTEMELAASEEALPRSSKLHGFRLVLDSQGVMHARTRLAECPLLTKAEKEPIVIPGESHLASLLIVETHRTNAHLGVSTVLATLRRRYWITRGRQRIKSILARCVNCKKQHGRTVKITEAPLPPSRLSEVIPFRSACLDFCGPFFTRRWDAQERQNVKEKNYIALFCCQTIRAIHLELVPSMNTVQTHLALRRFLSTYPECTALLTDNFRSFERAATDIKKVFNTVHDPAVKSLLSTRELRWDFICPRAPWHGGVYERLVGSAKAALKRTLGRSFLSFEELRTVLVETAAAINNRPITYTSDHPDEWTPVTPAQFLRGAPQHEPLCEVLPLDELSRSTIKKTLVERTTYYRSLVNRWRTEYITQLRSANRTTGREDVVIKDDDVCLLQDDQRPRSKWELVRVLDSHTGRDGKIRTYTVRFRNGYTTRRAAQLLCPLEVV